MWPLLIFLVGVIALLSIPKPEVEVADKCDPITLIPETNQSIAYVLFEQLDPYCNVKWAKIYESNLLNETYFTGSNKPVEMNFPKPGIYLPELPEASDKNYIQKFCEIEDKRVQFTHLLSKKYGGRMTEFLKEEMSDYNYKYIKEYLPDFNWANAPVDVYYNKSNTIKWFNVTHNGFFHARFRLQLNCYQRFNIALPVYEDVLFGNPNTCDASYQRNFTKDDVNRNTIEIWLYPRPKSDLQDVWHDEMDRQGEWASISQRFGDDMCGRICKDAIAKSSGPGLVGFSNINELREIILCNQTIQLESGEETNVVAFSILTDGLNRDR